MKNYISEDEASEINTRIYHPNLEHEERVDLMNMVVDLYYDIVKTVDTEEDMLRILEKYPLCIAYVKDQKPQYKEATFKSGYQYSMSFIDDITKEDIKNAIKYGLESWGCYSEELAKSGDKELMLEIIDNGTAHLDMFAECLHLDWFDDDIKNAYLTKYPFDADQWERQYGKK